MFDLFFNLFCLLDYVQLLHATKNMKARYKHKGLVESLTEQDQWPPFHAKTFTNLALVHQKIEQLQGKQDTILVTRLRAKGDINKILTSSIKLDNIHQIFTPFISTDQYPMSILIEGHAGIGKTTLCKEIRLQWASNKLLTSEKLVLLLMLRDPNLQKIISIEQLVRYAIPADQVQLVLNYLLTTNGIRVTLIIDGFDELSNELRSKSFIRKLIEGDALPNARVVVTSRPSASACIHQYVDRRIEVLGFENSSKEQYINDALEKHPSELQTLKLHLQVYPNIDAMCYIPLNMAIIVFLCLLGSLPPTATEMFESFIVHTVCYHLKRTKKITMQHTKDIKHLPLPVQQALQKLQKLAFYGLIADKIVFTVDELPDMCKNDPTCYGLLQSVECYCADESTAIKSFNFLHLGIQEYFAANYVASLKEHEVYALLKDSFLSINYKYLSNSKSVRLSNMWILYCGITKGECVKHFLTTCARKSHDCDDAKIMSGLHPDNYAVSEDEYSTASEFTSSSDNESCDDFHQVDHQITHTHAPSTPPMTSSPSFNSPLMEVASKQNWYDQETLNTVCISGAILEDARNTLYLFQCFQEAQDDMLCTILSKAFNTDKISLQGNHFIPHQVVSLGFFLIKSNKSWEELNLYSCHIGDHGINLLHRYLYGDKSCKQSIMTVDLSFNNLSGASSLLIRDIITHVQPNTVKLRGNNMANVNLLLIDRVKVLDISENDLGLQEVSAIAQMMKFLEELNLNGNKLGDDGVQILSKGILNTNTLKVLQVNNIGITAIGTSAIAISLQCNTSLEVLHMSFNAIEDDGAMVIAQIICNSKTLKKLNIHEIGISAEGSTAIAESLQNNISLEALDMRYNSIENNGAKAIAQMICNNQTLKELCIRSSGISATGATAIADSLQCNTSLVALDMSCNAIEKDGATAMAQAFKINKTLKKLLLFSDDRIDKDLSMILILSLWHNQSVTELGLPLTVGGTANVVIEVEGINSERRKCNVEELSIAFLENVSISTLSLVST